MTKRTNNIIVAVLAWYFMNTWPSSQATTYIGPFRSLTQCQIFRVQQIKIKVRTSGCANDSETYTPSWYLILNGGTTLSLPAGPFPNQTDCESFKTAVASTGEDTASACWPN